ncbi:hypothetical protein [Pseudoxanthomonas suwonensis]|nr:hypothetical protein [Pseudoxanthomonas suwonensis]
MLLFLLGASIGACLGVVAMGIFRFTNDTAAARLPKANGRRRPRVMA